MQILDSHLRLYPRPLPLGTVEGGITFLLSTPDSWDTELSLAHYGLTAMSDMPHKTHALRVLVDTLEHNTLRSRAKLLAGQRRAMDAARGPGLYQDALRWVFREEWERLLTAWAALHDEGPSKAPFRRALEAFTQRSQSTRARLVQRLTVAMREGTLGRATEWDGWALLSAPLADAALASERGVREETLAAVVEAAEGLMSAPKPPYIPFPLPPPGYLEVTVNGFPWAIFGTVEAALASAAKAPRGTQVLISDSEGRGYSPAQLAEAAPLPREFGVIVNGTPQDTYETPSAAMDAAAREGGGGHVLIRDSGGNLYSPPEFAAEFLACGGEPDLEEGAEE